MNPCEEHLEFKGDCCPVCLHNQIKDQQATIDKLAGLLSEALIELDRDGNFNVSLRSDIKGLINSVTEKSDAISID